MINNIDMMFNQNKGEFDLSLTALPFLADHSFQGMIVLPGSVYIEMALIIYNHLYNKTPLVIKDVDFDNIVLLSEKQTKLAFQIKENINDELKIEFSDITETKVDNLPIARLAIKNYLAKSEIELHKINLEEFQNKATIHTNSVEFYKRLSENGNQYGPEFQKIKEIWVNENKAIGKLINSSNENVINPGYHFLNTSLLDSFTQLLSSLSDSKGRTFALNSINEINLFDLELPEEIWCEAELVSDSDSGGSSFQGDLKISTHQGKFICS